MPTWTIFSVSVKDLMYACIYLTVSAYLHSSMYMKLAKFKIDLFSCGKQLARLLIIPLYLRKVCGQISVIVSSLSVNNTVAVYHWSHLTQPSYLIMLIYKLFFAVICCRFQVFIYEGQVWNFFCRDMLIYDMQRNMWILLFHILNTVSHTHVASLINSWKY